MAEQATPQAVQPLIAAEAHLRQYTEAEVQQFLVDDEIDAQTAAEVRRLLAIDAT